MSYLASIFAMHQTAGQAEIGNLRYVRKRATPSLYHPFSEQGMVRRPIASIRVEFEGFWMKAFYDEAE